MDRYERFNAIYVQWHPKILRWSIKRLRNWPNGNEWADDLTQEVFLRAWQRLGSYSETHADNWIWTVAYNAWKDWLRFWNQKKRFGETCGLIEADRSNDNQLLECLIVKESCASLTCNENHALALAVQGYASNKVALASARKSCREFLGMKISRHSGGRPKKVTFEQAQAIRSYSGAAKQVATLYGVSVRTVYDIWRWRIYRDD